MLCLWTEWWHGTFCTVFIDTLEEKWFCSLCVCSSHVSPGKTDQSFSVLNICTCRTHLTPRQCSGFSPSQNETLPCLHIYNNTFHVVYWKSANHIRWTVLDLKWQHFITHNQTLRFLLSPRMKSPESAVGLEKSTPVLKLFYQKRNKIWDWPSYYWAILWPYMHSGGRNHKKAHCFLQLKKLLLQNS